MVNNMSTNTFDQTLVDNLIDHLNEIKDTYDEFDETIEIIKEKLDKLRLSKGCPCYMKYIDCSDHTISLINYCPVNDDFNCKLINNRYYPTCNKCGQITCLKHGYTTPSNGCFRWLCDKC